jgi:hypothetical protein
MVKAVLNCHGHSRMESVSELDSVWANLVSKGMFELRTMVKRLRIGWLETTDQKDHLPAKRSLL